MKLRKILKKITSVTVALSFTVTGVGVTSFTTKTDVKAEVAGAAGNIPQNAEIFFDANGETQSFNVGSYWDVCSRDLSGNATNNANGLKMYSSTDGGIIKSDVKGNNENEEKTSYVKEILVPRNGGNSSSATVSGIYIPKNATVTLVGPTSDFVFGSLTVGNKEYTLNKTNEGNQFEINSAEGGRVEYQNGNGGLSGFTDSSITFKDAPVIYNGQATINLEQAYGSSSDEALLFKLTVAWEGEADYDGEDSTDGVFRIDYETGKQNIQYPDYGHNLVQQFDDGTYYSDGTYTIVGWGGSFSPGTYKNKISFLMKSGDETELDTTLSYMNICLYNNQGQCIQTINGSNLIKDGSEGGYSKLYFEPNTSDNRQIQGIKFYFNGTSEYKRGTLLIKRVSVTLTDPEESTTVEENYGPFTYTKEDKYNVFFDNNDKSYPYLRIYQSGITGVEWDTLNPDNERGEDYNGTVAGYNISINDIWHLWTMSTVDANIVKGDVNNMASRDALQIKYSNSASHTTYTNINGDVEKTGEWLVMTIKAADFDPNIKLVLKNGNTVVKTIPIVKDGNDESFVAEAKNNGAYVTAEDISSEYQTIYYHLNGNDENISFDSVAFDFSDVMDSKDASRYMYVSEIYLINPDVQISKEVKVNDGEFTNGYTSADDNDTLTYQMEVKNTGKTDVSNVKVEDEIPEGLTYVSGGTYSETTNKVSWDISSIVAGKTEKVSFVAKVNEGFSGLIQNKAKIISVNDEDANTSSNVVTTTVVKDTPDSFVFFAEVNQKTTLKMALGSTSTTTTEKETVTKNYTISVPFTSNGQASTATISGVSIPSGATVNLTGPNNGGFVMTSVAFSNQTYYTDYDHLDKTDGFTANGTLNYHCKNNSPENGKWDDPACTGKVSSFIDNSSITLNNVNEYGSTDVTISLEQIYNSNKDFTLTVSYEVEKEVPGGTVQDKFNSVPGSTDMATIDANGILGNNSGEIYYTSTKTGTDNFNVKVEKGSQVIDVPVTVYNYRTSNHIYVLDYGLPVDLAKNDNYNDNYILKDAVLDLNVEGLKTGYSFCGISNTKRNSNKVADSSDYRTPYGVDMDTPISMKNGNVSYSYDPSNEDSLELKYTPTKYMDSVDTFYYGVQVSKDGVTSEYDSTNATPVMEGKVDVMPASVVYYEDNYSQSGKDNTDPTKGIIYAGDNVTSNDKTFDSEQSNNLELQYGYDSSYAGANSDFSGNGATTMGDSSMAAFEFKGTGFDIISRTSDVTGALIVKVYEKNKNGTVATINNKGTYLTIKNGLKNLVQSMVVDTYYVDGDLYQIPVISWKSNSSEAKDYIVLITSYDRESAGKKVYIDGIRIYNPITSSSTTNTGVGEDGSGTVDDQYNNIGEKNAEIKEVRQLIFGEGFKFNYDDPLASTFGSNPQITLAKFNGEFTGANFLSGSTVVESVDANGNTTAPGATAQMTRDMMNYAVQGPNNELYLSSGNGIGFYATENNEEQKTLQLGLKIVTGTTHEIAYWSNGGWNKLTDLNSKTENYYRIDVDKLPYVTVDGKKRYTVILKEGPTGSSTANDFISLTNIKINGYTLTPLDKTAMSRNLDLKISNFRNLEGLDKQSGYIEAGSTASYSFTTSTDVDLVKLKADNKELNGVRVLYNDSDGVRTWRIKFTNTGSGSISSFDLYVSDGNDRYNIYKVTGKTVSETN